MICQFLETKVRGKKVFKNVQHKFLNKVLVSAPQLLEQVVASRIGIK
jgi:hypothetical protein